MRVSISSSTQHFKKWKKKKRKEKGKQAKLAMAASIDKTDP